MAWTVVSVCEKQQVGTSMAKIKSILSVHEVRNSPGTGEERESTSIQAYNTFASIV
jgi:hypothetical protein